MTHGRLIVLEGIDGSGKGTQSQLLCNGLRAAGHATALLGFPRYAETMFGEQIGRFLNGQFGPLDAVHPLLASVLYAGDRFESRQLLEQSLAEHAFVVCDRYVPSNIAHQGAKVFGAERQSLVDWILRLEHELFGLPRPDQVLYLDLPVPIAQDLIALKSPRNYTDRAADLQEADAAYLGRVRDVYLDLAATEPGWHTIRCVDAEDRLRSKTAIAAEILESVLAVR